MRSIVSGYDYEERVPGPDFEELLDGALGQAKKKRRSPFLRDAGEKAVDALHHARRLVTLVLMAMKRKNKWGRVKFELNTGDRHGILALCRDLKKMIPRFMVKKPRTWEPNLRSTETVDVDRFERLLIEEKKHGRHD